jgi:error-prone DNA polymerase
MESLGNYGFHSFYGSLLSPRELAELAYHLGYRTVGISDMGGLWGAVEFSQACRRMEIQPVFGCRLQVEQLGLIQLTVKNTESYQLLSRYLSLWKMQGNRVPLVAFQFFWREFGGHFHLSVRPIPPRNASPQTSDWIVWKRTWDLCVEQLGPELWIELQWNTAREQELQRRVYRELSSLTDRWVAMSGARCVAREQWEVLRVLQAIGTLTRVSQAHPDKLIPGDYSFVAAEALRHRFGKVPRVLKQTRKFAEACDFDFNFDQLWLPHVGTGEDEVKGESLEEQVGLDRRASRSYSGGLGETALAPNESGARLRSCETAARSPQQSCSEGAGDVPELEAMDVLMAAEDAGGYGSVREKTGDERNERDYRQLRYLCLRGIILRYVKEHYPWKDKPSREELLERIQRELAIIRETGYAGYFLIFYDIVLACHARNIPMLARGSAAGSLVCYSLGVSNVCPFRFGLNFERFLNRERLKHSKLPDIDLDLPWDRRDEVIEYVYQKYGADHVAMIGGFSTFKSRAAIADVAKTMGVSESEARYMTRYMPYNGMADMMYKRKDHQENKHLQHEERFEEILKVALCLDGLPRHPMMHPCGIVIADRPLMDFMPLLPSNKGFMMTQMSMQPVEDLGLLKLDLLGQAGLSVIRDTCENIRQESGVFTPLDRIDYYDAEIYEMMACGEARGVFHIESPAMTSLLKMCRCADIDCLVGVVSVIRPGAANEDKKTLFARRYLGQEAPSYVHPDLETVLNDCFGLMVYEEHILLVAHHWAGMDLGRADLLRRILIKKLKGRDLKELEEEFYACAEEKGRDDASIETVWKLLGGFSGYMFNKAHGAAYAVEAFQGAYLKKHYPGYFMTAVLQSGRGFYSALFYMLELLRRGNRFELPDVTRPVFTFWFREGAVLYPLSRIKGLSRKFLDTWKAELEKRAFRDWDDFLVRVLPDQADLLLLAKSGALHLFFENRYEAVWWAKHYRREFYAERSERLFEPEPVKEAFPFQPKEPEVFARWESELLGYPVTLSPFALWLKGIDRMSTVGIDRLRDYVGREVEIAGVVVAVRNFIAVNGKPMKFVSIADETGVAEVTLFPQAYQRMAYVVSRSKAIRVRVLVEWDKTESSITVQGVSLIEGRTGIREVDKALARAV